MELEKISKNHGLYSWRAKDFLKSYTYETIILSKNRSSNILNAKLSKPFYKNMYSSIILTFTFQNLTIPYKSKQTDNTHFLKSYQATISPQES